MQLSRFALALQDLDEFGYRRLGGSAAEDQPDVPGAEHELFFVRQAHQPENRPGGGLGGTMVSRVATTLSSG